MTIELAPDARQRLDQHLDAVEQALISAGRSRDQRRTVVDDLETQILDMLAKKSEAPTLPDLEGELATIDPPTAYGAESAPAAAATVPPPAPSIPAVPPSPRYSRTAIAGFICILAGMMLTLPMLVLLVPWYAARATPVIRPAQATVYRSEPTTSEAVDHNDQDSGLTPPRNVGVAPAATIPTRLPGAASRIGVGALCALFLIGPLGIAGTVLGWISFVQIRRSNGLIHGKGLALFDGLFYPVLTLLVLLLVA